MAKFQKLHSALDNIERYANKLEASGVDLTTLAKGDATGESLRRNDARIMERQAKGRKEAAIASATFAVGDMARTRMGQTGKVVEVTDRYIAIDVAGAVKNFAPVTLTRVEA